MELDHLPNELIDRVLTFVPERDLSRSRRVSKRWRDLCEHAVSRKPIVNVIIAVAGVQPFIQGVDNVLVANPDSTPSLMRYLLRVKRLSLTFAKKVKMSKRDLTVLNDTAEAFISNSSDSLISLYINNSGIRNWISLPRLPILRNFFMDTLDSETLQNLIAAAPFVEKIRFRFVDMSSLPRLPLGLKVFKSKFVESGPEFDPLELEELAKSPALQTMEQLSMITIPNSVPVQLAMPCLTEVALRLEEQYEVGRLSEILASAPNIQKLRLKIGIEWIEDEDGHHFWNQAFKYLKNLTELWLEGVVDETLFGSIAANCHKINLINCRTYRHDFQLSYFSSFTAMESLRHLDIVTDRIWGSMIKLRELAEQRPLLHIKVYVAQRIPEGYASPPWPETFEVLRQWLPDRVAEYVPLSDRRNRRGPGSSVVVISPQVPPAVQ